MHRRDRIVQTLRDLGRPGEPAARYDVSPQGLSIDVDGVGSCRFPLSPERIQALIDAARPSPFGHKDQTLHDPEVRDSWEIGPEHVHLDPERWPRRLERVLSTLRPALGLPDDATVVPTLHKLLVYGPGQFFAPHRDTEKTPGTAATLVMVLPTDHEGGELVVTHGGRQLVFATDEAAGAYQIPCVAFYADCLHETRPVRAGHRVVLTFTLEVSPAVPGPPAHTPDGLIELLSPWFEDEDAWLVVLLEHQYSSQSLSWTRLKNGDRVQAEALRQAASALDCHCLLALAETVAFYPFHGDAADDHEPDDLPAPAPPAQSGWNDLSFDGDDPWTGDGLTPEAPPDPDGDIGPLAERTVTLIQAVNEEDQPCAVPDETAADELILTTAEEGRWSAYAAEAEPWTGNEGGEAVKWYHLTAVVLVPRGRWFAPDAIRAKDVPAVRKRTR